MITKGNINITIEYRGYEISPNLTGYVNYDICHPDEEMILGHGESVDDCKEQIDIIISDNE